MRSIDGRVLFVEVPDVVLLDLVQSRSTHAMPDVRADDACQLWCDQYPLWVFRSVGVIVDCVSSFLARDFRYHVQFVAVADDSIEC